MIEIVYLAEKDNKMLDIQFTLGLRETVFIKMFALNKGENRNREYSPGYWEVNIEEYESDLL